MPRILMVLPQAPFPRQGNGFTVRMNPVFEYLAQRHEVDLVIACDTRRQAAMYADEARRHARRVFEFIAPQDTGVARKAKTMIGLATPGRAPFQLLEPWAPALAKFVADQIAGTKYDAVHWVNLTDAAVHLASRLRVHPRLTVDYVDSCALHAHREAATMTGGLQRRMGELEAKRLANWEKRVSSAHDATIYITSTDAQFADGTLRPKVHVVPNGVVGPPPELLQGTPTEPSVGFLGNMRYESNINAALRLYGIFKRLKRTIPDLRLRIIGRNPSPEISNLRGPDVVVTGTVDSIWPHIMETTVFGFPMVHGAGLQNKVLEVLHAARPVVVSPICLAGLEAEGAGEAVVTASTDEQFEEALQDLLGSPERRRQLGDRGHTFVQQYSWPSLLTEYEKVVLGAAGGDVG